MANLYDIERLFDSFKRDIEDKLGTRMSADSSEILPKWKGRPNVMDLSKLESITFSVNFIKE
jgi:hypothetical protein